jgi:protein-S-isoprenylcysteine O-methyltransferase Ste14
MDESASGSAAWQTIAWLGGALFAASLAVGAWTFVVTFATPGPASTAVMPAVVTNVALFSAFALHHSVMARTRARGWMTARVPAPLERSTYVWLASLLFLAVCLGWQRTPGVLYDVTGPLRWVLAGVQLAGVALTVAAARVLDGLDLAGIRQVRRAPRPPAIRVVWPFTWVRHPIYLGWMLIVCAATPMTADRAVWAAVSSAYLVIAMPWEERTLSAAAGPAYQAYCRQVRWRLVPGVY